MKQSRVLTLLMVLAMVLCACSPQRADQPANASESINANESISDNDLTDENDDSDAELQEADDQATLFEEENPDESVSSPEEIDYHTYIDVIRELASQYGGLHIVQDVGEWKNEANGLCYLNLIDFTGDGVDELFAVCKNEGEKHYTGYIYTIANGSADLIYENPQIEYNSQYAYDIVYLGHTEDTGFIFGTGWDAPDIDDRTFFWYQDGEFEPVYRSKGYYDGNLDEEIIEDELKVVDIFDDEHNEELWNSFPRVTLRAKGEEDESGKFFGSNDLRKTIDDTAWKLGAGMSELPVSVTISEEKLSEIAKAAVYHCMETDIGEWVPEVGDTETFWDEMCFYCNFTFWIYTADYHRSGEDGEFQIIPNNLLKNAAYAIYKDFDGNLPAIDGDIWRAWNNDDQSTAIVIGDDAPFTVTSEKYQQNEDGSIDAEYVTEYWENTPGGTYHVHFEPNPHYRDVDSGVTYYYRVSYVERVDQPQIEEESNIDELTMEGLGIPYGYYSGGKPQGDGVFGLDMDLYEDLTFSIVSSFDLFSDEEGDEYSYAGTYMVEGENDDGNPVLLFQCDQGDFELVWDGEELGNDTFFAWYEGE